MIYKSDTVGQIFKRWTARDNALAVTATVNGDEDDFAVRKWNAEEAKDKMTKAYADFAPEVQDLIGRIPALSIYANAVCDVDCLGVWSDGPMVVVGDAAHGMTPSLGQGTNVGLEDAAELGYLLGGALADGARVGSYECVVRALNKFCSVRQERVPDTSLY